MKTTKYNKILGKAKKTTFDLIRIINPHLCYKIPTQNINLNIAVWMQFYDRNQVHVTQYMRFSISESAGSGYPLYFVLATIPDAGGVVRRRFAESNHITFT